VQKLGSAVPVARAWRMPVNSEVRATLVAPEGFAGGGFRVRAVLYSATEVVDARLVMSVGVFASGSQVDYGTIGTYGPTAKALTAGRILTVTAETSTVAYPELSPGSLVSVRFGNPGNSGGEFLLLGATLEHLP
jgi:hypothetical protein